jgi:uncharacterized protein
MNDFILILSLASLGFFGGFSHCMGMCAPFVLTQVSNRLQKTSLEEFSNFQKLKNLALLPYHAGRISTYSIIGFFCSFFTKNIEDFTGFKIFSSLLLILASIIFLSLLFEGNFLFLRKIKLPFKSITLKKPAILFAFLKRLFSKQISLLFQNPQGLKGYALGLILGFIPCGLLYSAFLIASAITNPVLAAIGMMLFGIGTFPSLFLTASGGYVFLRLPEFRFFIKIVILINAIMLLSMAIKLIN